MNKKLKYIDDIIKLFLFLNVLTLPFSFFLNNLIISITCLSILIRMVCIKKINLDYKLLPLYVIFFLKFIYIFFIPVELIGLFWKDIGFSTAIFVIPFFYSNFNYDTGFIKKLLNLFLITILLILFSSIVINLFLYQNNYSSGNFMYINLLKAFSLHPTYFSSYIIVLLIYILFKVKNQTNLKNITIFILLSFGLFLTASKAGIILYIFLIPLILYKFLSIKKLQIKHYLIFISIFIFSVVIVSSKSENFLKTRINTAIKTLNSENPDLKFDPIGHRLKLIKISKSLIKEKIFFGHGTGLAGYYINNKCTSFYNEARCNQIKGYGPHNQFLNYWIEGGVILFLLLILIFIIIIYSAFLRKYYLIVFASILFIILLGTESYLDRHRGLILFCYFVGIFFAFLKSNKELKINNK